MAKFRNDIQGLRALAVVAVVINHAFPDYLRGGFVGVDIFFVISGYLIPQIIVREIEAGQFSIANFYRRRARRILPALFVVLGVSLVCGWLFLPPMPYRELARTAITTSLFVSNFDFAKLTDYFGGDAELKPLLHMWSLAVEEQYYILFPPFLYLIWKKLSRPKAHALLWALALIFLVVAEVGRIYSPASAYYLLPTRAIELMVGTLVGIGGIPSLHSARARDAASLLGVAMMLAAIVLFNPTTPFPGISALLPCIGAALVIYAGKTDETAGGRLLSFRAAVYVGAISYSLYLWHWPILAFLRNLTSVELPIPHATAAVVLAFGLAILSYHFVERPFLSPWGAKFPYLKLSAVGIAGVIMVGGVIFQTYGVKWRFSAPAQQMFAANMDFNPRRNVCHNDGASIGIPYAKSCAFGAANVAPDVAVWGDSHGAEMVVYLGERAAAHGRSVRQLTSSACPPSLQITVRDRPHCSKSNQQMLDALVKDAGIKTVVLTTNSLYYDDKAGLEAGMRASVAALVAAHKTVILVKQTPIMPYDIGQKAGVLRQLGLPLDDVGMPRADALVQAAAYDGFMDELGRKYRLTEYDPKTSLCDADFCHGVQGGSVILYFNREHLGVKGAYVAFKGLADSLYGGA